VSSTLDVLVLAAHPDDAEIGCAGTIRRCAQAGARVGIVDLTRGEAGTLGTVEERANEAAAAAKLLGVARRENLGLPDGAIAEDDSAMTAVIRMLRQLRPTLLLAPFERDVHPDHVATSRIARRAFFHAGLARVRPDLGAAARPKALLFYPALEAVEPTFCVDISPVMDEKRGEMAPLEKE